MAQADSSGCLDPAEPGMAFESLRYEETFCRRPATPRDPWWFGLKNMPLGETSVSVGGELRARLEDYRPVRAGLRGGEADTYATARALVHADIQRERWRVFAQLGYWDSAGREGGPAPTDVDRGDVQQLFVEWHGDGFVRAGRQELLYGSGRLLGLRRSPNIRLTFDGARAGVPLAGGMLDLFHFRPVDIDPAGWNNQGNSGERVTGMYYTRPGDAAWLGLDVYAFRFERDVQRYQNAAGKDERNVAGVRLYGTAGRIDLNSELILQGGRTAGQTVRAWSLQNDFVFKVDEHAPWSWGLKANAASGDSRADDRTFETFQPIYAAPPYFMQSSLITAANIANLQPYVEWRATTSLTLTGELQANWRMETGDGYYQPPLVVQPLDRHGHYLKSRILKHYHALHQGRLRDPSGFHPLHVILVEAPDDGDCRRLCEGLIRECLPSFEPGRRFRHVEMCVEVLIRSGVRQVLIDEAGNLLHAGRVRQQQTLAVLKRLTNCGLTLCIATTENMRNVLAADEQLHSRFHPLLLPRFQESEEFRVLLAGIDAQQPGTSHLDSQRFVRWFLANGYCTTGAIEKLIYNASLRVAGQGNAALTLELLQEAMADPLPPATRGDGR